MKMVQVECIYAGTDIELQNDFIQKDGNKNNEQDNVQNDINLVVKDEIKETDDFDFKDYEFI